jgi:hypothetical protein
MRYIFSMFFTLSTIALCALSNEQGILGNDLKEDQITISSELPQENTVLPVSELECRRRHLHHIRGHGCQNRNESQAVYASFSTSETVEVSAGSSIPFSTTSAISKNGIQLAAGGQIFISQPGDYFINFGASVFLGVPTTISSIPTVFSNQIALSLDGVFPQPGTNIAIINSGPATGYLTSASTILSVENASPEQPAVLSVVNNSTVVGSVLPLGSVLRDVVAYITINRLNDLTTQNVDK